MSRMMPLMFRERTGVVPCIDDPPPYQPNSFEIVDVFTGSLIACCAIEQTKIFRARSAPRCDVNPTAVIGRRPIR